MVLGGQGVSVVPEKLTEVNLLKRHVLKRCIYGVDLNPMAVELAKVSLWLDAFTIGAPLSFLDHHLRCGNSLIGATFADLEKATEGQLFGIDYEPMLRAIRHVLQVNQMADATAAEVRKSAGEYTAARRDLSGYQIVLDLLVAQHFGMPDAPEVLRVGADLDLSSRDKFAASVAALGMGDVEKRKREKKKELSPTLVTDVESLAARPDLRFFHWEIEFPEVFFGFADPDERRLEHKDRTAKGSAGFDAVVGNPPWGGLRTLGHFEDFLKGDFVTARKGTDWFALFVESSLRRIHANAAYGAVIPSGWQTAVESKELRHLISEVWSIDNFVNLPYDTFPDAYTEAAVMTGRCATRTRGAWRNAVVNVLIMDRHEVLRQIDSDDDRWFRVAMEDWFALDAESRPFYTFWTPAMLSIATKVASQSRPLAELCDVQRGITPFHPHEGRQHQGFAVALDGELRRYRYDFSGRSVVEYHPGIAEYREPEWFSGSRGIVRQLISRQFRIQAVIAHESFVVNQSHQILRPKPGVSVEFVVGVVNSRLLSYLHVNASALAQRDDFPKLVLDDTRSLPLPRIDEANVQRTSAAGVLNHLADQESAFEQIRRLDRGHLSGIIAAGANELMCLNQALRETSAQFLSSLERDLSARSKGSDVASIDELRGKTKLLQFYGDYDRGEPGVPFAEVVEVLRMNQRRLPSCVNQKGYLDALEEKYTGALDSTMKVKTRMRKVDCIIDQLVYRLFDLDEHEIAAVESG